jgi:hypothetical protein
LRTDGLFLGRRQGGPKRPSPTKITARMAVEPLLDPARNFADGEVLSGAKVVQITMWSQRVSVVRAIMWVYLDLTQSMLVLV